MNKDNQVNLLEFCLSPDLGGLELFMVNCFNDFKTKTNCKIVLAPNTKLANYIDDKVYYINRNKFFPIFPAIKLAKFIDKHDIDIIHFHWTRDIATVVLAKILSKKNPKIIQTRNMSMTRFKSDFYHRWLYKNISAMHAVTHQVQTQLEKFIPNDIRPNINMVYMGTKQIITNHDEIKILKEKYNLKDEFIIGIVGRIEEGKGQYLVIEAIKILEQLSIKALIVGNTMDDKYLNELKQKTISLGIQDKIIFTGFTKQVDTHMQLFDTNILATPKETFGLVVIEAMINKICMIATNKGGPLEIIDNCVNGLLFDRTSDDLAIKIKSLYENEQYKNKLALSGYQKAKDMFDRDIQNNKLYNLIKDI
jgi:glycosyltransferase involved in cell wall biosynthesis